MRLDVFNKPTEEELREGGYYERAEKIVLGRISLERLLKTLLRN